MPAKELKQLVSGGVLFCSAAMTALLSKAHGK